MSEEKAKIIQKIGSSVEDMIEKKIPELLNVGSAHAAISDLYDKVFEFVKSLDKNDSGILILEEIRKDKEKYGNRKISLTSEIDAYKNVVDEILFQKQLLEENSDDRPSKISKFRKK